MKRIIQFNALLESLAGVVLLLRPEWLLMAENPHIQGIVLSKLYGIAALTMGIFSYIVSKNFQFTLMYKQFILMIITFHLLIAFQMYSIYQQGISASMGAFGLHLAVAMIMAVIYLRDFQKFKA
ncbi:MAG: hypothetical protein IPM42_06485 [Saprospiraceae bacterium]|nr:hypothetical protein [Saprospiraceae bacterium]